VGCGRTAISVPLGGCSAARLLSSGARLGQLTLDGLGRGSTFTKLNIQPQPRKAASTSSRCLRRSCQSSQTRRCFSNRSPWGAGGVPIAYCSVASSEACSPASIVGTSVAECRSYRRPSDALPAAQSLTRATLPWHTAVTHLERCADWGSRQEPPVLSACLGKSTAETGHRAVGEGPVGLW
jgi:hypothetical protein